MANDLAADRQAKNPLFSPAAILLAGLSLSIGWGIRGNYGHEIGAMFPGALTAIAICLISNREDWRERVAYFACFGALGWAFGGSISYMQVLAYTNSGHAASQFYGYYGLFLIGFLWAALGGGATALPAVLDRKSLSDMFQPLSLLLALWTLLFFVEGPIERMIQGQLGVQFSGAPSGQRHESVLYWLDSDWLSVLVVIAGLLSFDLVDRRFKNSLWLAAFVLAGCVAGYLAQRAIAHFDWSNVIHDSLVRPQGDTIKFGRERLITNWPLILEGGPYLGGAIGLLLGVGAYFALFGKFRRGSSLFLHMALGWYVGFLLFPVLLNVRLTPPRGDNWAGVVGVYAGALLYLVRRRMWPVVVASLVAGTIGGVGWTSVACVESLLESCGNPKLAPGLAQSWTEWQQRPSLTYPPAFADHLTPSESWKFWQDGTNWHSFLEQSYGFIHGIGLIVAMGLLVRRVGPLDNEAKRHRWTEIVALTLVVPVLLYVNMVQNVQAWASASKILAAELRMPLIGFPLSTLGWFNIFFGIAGIALVMLLSIHSRRRLAILDQNWVGRGQLLFLLLLWTFVIGNWGRALLRFDERRLLTEGMVTINAVFASILVLLVPRSSPDPLPVAGGDFRKLLKKSVAATVICAAVVPPLEALCVRAVYGDAPGRRISNTEGPQMRFGPRAYWKHWPLLKGEKHR